MTTIYVEHSGRLFFANITDCKCLLCTLYILKFVWGRQLRFQNLSKHILPSPKDTEILVIILLERDRLESDKIYLIEKRTIFADLLVSLVDQHDLQKSNIEKCYCFCWFSLL